MLCMHDKAYAGVEVRSINALTGPDLIAHSAKSHYQIALAAVRTVAIRGQCYVYTVVVQEDAQRRSDRSAQMRDESARRCASVGAMTACFAASIS